MIRKILNRIKVLPPEEGRLTRELTDQLNVAEPTVSRWCTNTAATPSLDTLRDREGS